MKLLYLRGAHRRERLHLNSAVCVERGRPGPVHLCLVVGDGGYDSTGQVCLKQSQVQRLHDALGKCLKEWPEP